MVIVADTSFLFSLYGDDSHSCEAIAWLKERRQVVTITSMTEFELANAFRFASFRKVVTEEHAGLYWEHFTMDRAAGRITVRPANLANIIAKATKLSEQLTAQQGHRSFDILHVAGAIELGAEIFLTFDRNQASLAKSQELVVPTST